MPEPFSLGALESLSGARLATGGNGALSQASDFGEEPSSETVSIGAFMAVCVLLVAAPGVRFPKKYREQLLPKTCKRSEPLFSNRHQSSAAALIRGGVVSTIGTHTTLNMVRGGRAVAVGLKSPNGSVGGVAAVPWTIRSLRQAMKDTLYPHDHEAFHSATGTSIDQLCDLIGGTSVDTPSTLLSDLTGTTKVLYPHPLNAYGLHAFRALMAERLSDAVRAKGVHSTTLDASLDAEQQSLARKFHREGFLVLPLDDRALPPPRLQLPLPELTGMDVVGWKANLNPSVYRLLRSLSGWRQPWLSATSTALQALTHVDRDIQHYAHVDTHTQCLKAFVWAPGTNLSRGPLHYVNGSHRSSAGKLRWLFERTRQLTGTSPLPPTHTSLHDAALGPHTPFSEGTHGFHSSIRVEGFVPHGDSVDFGRYGFSPPVPMLLPSAEQQRGRATLVIADTSGWHYRGYAPSGTKRVAARFHNLNDNRKSAWSCYSLLGTNHEC